MLWAFKARLEALEASLKLQKEDANLRLLRETELLLSPLKQEVESLTAALKKEKDAASQLRHNFKMLHELCESPQQYATELRSLWRSNDERYFHLRSNGRKAMEQHESVSSEPYVKPEPEYVSLHRKRVQTSSNPPANEA